jgi:hypothetical protein
VPTYTKNKFLVIPTLKLPDIISIQAYVQTPSRLVFPPNIVLYENRALYTSKHIADGIFSYTSILQPNYRGSVENGSPLVDDRRIPAL